MESRAHDRTTVPEAIAPPQASLAPFEPAPLERLADEARRPGTAGTTSLDELHRQLLALAPSETHGRALLGLLEARAFDRLRASDGRETRLVAIEALLRLGYPWALEIDPDDLAWYRGRTQSAKFRKALLFLMVTSAFLGVLGSLWRFL